MAKEYEHRQPFMVINNENNTLQIRVATQLGYQELPLDQPGIADLSYPNSKLRRARVQGNGQISPALTCSGSSLYVIQVKNE